MALIPNLPDLTLTWRCRATRSTQASLHRHKQDRTQLQLLTLVTVSTLSRTISSPATIIHKFYRPFMGTYGGRALVSRQRWVEI